MPTSQSATSTPDIIARRGDVILCVGDGAETSSLLVSSVVLGQASPVFDTMFYGRFTESQSLSTDCPPTLSLRHDNPKSMRILCLIIHMRTAELPESLAPDELVNLAVICDKYDCTNVVQAWASIWVAKVLPQPEATYFEKLLFATYVLDMATEFNQVTRSIVLERTEPISLVAATHQHNLLPMGLFDKLLQEISRCKEHFQGVYCKIVTPLDEVDSDNPSDKHFFSAALFSMWSVSDLSVKELLNRLAIVGPVKELDPYDACPKLNRELVSDLEYIYRSVKGLCLDCIKREEFEESEDSRYCRIDHEDRFKGDIMGYIREDREYRMHIE